MKKVLSISVCIMALVVIALWAPDTSAFKFYSQNVNDIGNCADCHLGFRETGNYFSNKDGAFWGTSLHNGHLNNTTVGSSCDNCHGGADITSVRMVNLSSSGNAADGVNAIACSGCHVGPGLRAHHAANGITDCAVCHSDPTPATENIAPPWFGSVINDITGTNLEPCNANGEEDFAGSTLGLDNDGDNAYDTADPDCDVCVPTGLPDDNCDGIDDDCNGTADDAYVPTQTFCGVGVCANTGLLECQDGQLVDTCVELPQDEATDVTCDGRDGDCDGSIDEDYTPVPTTCGVGECAGNTGAEECQNGVIVDTCDPLAGAAADDATCDGLDNDCDGAIDEDFASTPTSCGVGECAATGSTTCVSGVEGDTCTPGTPAADDATCDGLDNDCDGTVDEDFASTPTSCGVGECAATGVTECVGGTEGDTCTPGTPAADDSTCDGLDNDCDGAIDEDYVTTPTTCGVGECAATGVTECVGGVEGDTCTPGSPAADDSTCDGLDNDCDGAIDEDYASTPTSCGVGECAATGATTCVSGIEGDTCTPGTPAAEICDNLDNNCDGSIDESLTQPTSCGVGECGSTGVETCTTGVWGGDTCTPGSPTAEVCDNLDNNCDGSIDESLTQPTSCGVGECGSTGVETCTAGVWGGDTCTPGTPAADDSTCDGLDNDCDGAVDEDYAPIATSCGVGECAATGVTECVAGVESDTCTPGTPAADDATCDGLDNDCDSAIDEDYAPMATTCGVGECAATGVTECVAGVESDSCTPGTPAADDATCDGLDNDCDGAIDEDYAPMATTCGVGECAATGVTECVAGVESDSCTPGTPAADDATCDGLDNDCDGAVDEDYAPIATSCGVGDCAATGVTECVAGVEGDTCTPGTPAADDATCDGLDNDCDSAIDEDYAPMATTCGVGECAATGVTECVAGVESDSCTPGTPAADDATCDGLDNDCDGAIDEDYAPMATTCGVGECAATGVTECVAGVESDTCTPGTPAADDSTCDGLDNDCDGAVDEDFAPITTSCGVGECAATGVTECVDGVESDTCTPGSPAADDSTCDGLDNDCDGAIDEDYAPMATTCGVGECAATGVTECVAGVESDSCTPGTPAADDATCDGLDNDCDGAVDEDFAPIATSCGVGECAATGVTECVGGVEGDTCTPGTPAADDATCDGLDNDCDSAVDEDYAPVATSCGVGECAAAGATTCTDGVESDTCTPGTPAADDATCDGLDNDCDGAVDEDFAPIATSCGVGECAATGVTECVAGVESDSCTPGTPAADDSTCDGLDNDCDGAIDEDYASTPTTCGIGECAATGATTCVDGVESDTCTPGSPAADDSTCDGLDNDCDGATDEDYAPMATTCGVGECAATGQTTCVGGTEGDTCTPGTPAADDATCDGLDNDCDGAVDEDFASTPTSCGVGECAATGATTCAGGVEGDTCTPGTPTADDSTCDGLDNDCDGAIDEDFASTPTSCGVGECAATGATTCAGGVEGDTCTPGTPAADDATCDGLDNDCDGAIDEDFASTPTSCGTGECAATGQTTCVDGSEGDTCTPGTPAADDATCDGLDNDCDGAVDEDFASTPTSCGVGECAATGAITCVDGVEGDTCTPGTPAADDATCDGLDNDCDGAVDEDFASTPTSCGVGECAATGATTCAGGVEGDTCTPGTPTADDSTCDGLDNDCDGATDEDYAPMATTCGVGECAATGQTTCVGGTEGDTCTPGTPAADDATCDGLDNDCDGAIDEDYMPMATTCGLGECTATGQTTCVDGTEGDTCTPGTPGTEVCDAGNLDEDCDGQANEGCDCIEGDTRPTTCGAGECSATGIETCTGGVWGNDTCTPGTPAADDATCDGLDNDCDGTIDEDYASTPTTCGIGECAAAGATTCVGGIEGDTCTPGTPAADDATCDGLDNDCDGAIDEDYSPMATTCGVGECAATGAITCVDGVEGDTCTPGTPAADDATCDGLDNDCDGAIDEDFASTQTSCGTGECAATGQTTCVGGTEGDTCTPGTPAADDATCDGLDNDCDGAIDEDYMPMATTCGLGECTATGQTTCVDGTEGDTCTPGTPGTEVCDAGNLDEDCDGQANEGCDCIEGDTRPTTCGAGECSATGIETCTGGVWGNDTCTPGTPAADDATCDGLDNDCDGTIDEDYASTPTTCGIGECAAAGATTCVGGIEGDTCTPGTPAADDATCDGLDNDCDGAIDEDYSPMATTCGVGECAATGAITCVDGVEGDTCTPGTPAADDATCDGLDNDCDGAIDEDFASTQTSCGTGECAATGQTTCVGGTEGDTCTPGTPAADDATCDGLDNDCDGAIDEDYMPMATTCGLGECTATGQTTCVDGTEGDTCTPGTPGTEVCDAGNLDEDCDGQANEGCDCIEGDTRPTTCGAGECAATGIETCTGGVWGNDTCTPGTPAADDATCDGLDNDCDGAIDEDFASTPTSCGVGECAATGAITCVDGVEGDTCTPGTPAADDATCDGLDNDCDGAIDEDFASTPTSCGVGECAATGAITCVDGVEGDTCTPGTPAADDATCDGLDNDCDGAIDEDFASTPTSCGVGECAATGQTTCVGGTEGDTCTPGTPAADDATCDGLDNDCDGAIDEDFASTPTSCGVGECAATGATTCVSGIEGDTCTPGTPAADDSTCDGLDNDCDGAIDEDFASTPTSCGVGECAATGAITCVDGVEGDTCTPGTPAADDATCDGLDNDCDGAIDEDFASTPTTCGIGECAASGATTCVDGIEGDTCTPGTPAADDATCDGLDNDCDGATDEDYASTPTSCGIGECVAAGATTCVGGIEGDTCTPGTPAADDATCDGLDNDCDGAIDEDFASTPTTCGIGECAATGATTCTDGVEGDTCTPGSPTEDTEVTCDDGVDNDCDGLTDDFDPDCSVEPQNELIWAAGNFGTILNTTDGGANWSAQNSGTSNEIYALDFFDANTGWAVGWKGTILKTTDGGANWSAQTSGTTAKLNDLDFIDANTGWAVGNSGTILNTTDGGANWSAQNSGTSEWLNGLDFINANTGWAVGDFAILLKTIDGGANWSAQNSGTSADLNDLDFIDANTGWAVGGSGTILKTIDGGANWSDQSSGTTAELNDLDFIDANTGWAVGGFGAILNTTDGGANWSAQNSGTSDNLFALGFIDANTGWAVGWQGTILKTTDGGATWSAQTSGTSRNLNTVAIAPDVTPTTVPGDCNADGLVDAGDISAVVLEIFDGDGSLPADTPRGTFPGDPAGCDANEDRVVDAGDISCTVLLIFSGPGACGG